MTSYWPTIGHLKCILVCHLDCVMAFHWSFVLYDIIFYCHYTELCRCNIFCIPVILFTVNLQFLIMQAYYDNSFSFANSYIKLYIPWHFSRCKVFAEFKELQSQQDQQSKSCFWFLIKFSIRIYKLIRNNC